MKPDVRKPLNPDDFKPLKLSPPNGGILIEETPEERQAKINEVFKPKIRYEFRKKL